MNRGTNLVAVGLLSSVSWAQTNCPQDLSGNGVVNGEDLTVVLADWGPCVDCASDFDGNAYVDGADLAILLGSWGRTTAIDCDCDGETNDEELANGANDFDQDGIPDTCDPPDSTGTLLFAQTLDHRSPGPYDETMMEEDWNDPTWSNGVRDERVTIVETEEPGNYALAVHYPEGSYGTSATGAQWKVPLNGSFERVTLSYRMKFLGDFDFVRGGKLPGLIGGTGNTGGSVPDGTDGWSARMMWRTDGAIVQYVYHPDQPNSYGEDLPWTTNGSPLQFEPNRWYTVRHDITMNTPGEYDGIIRTWLDGNPALEVTSMRFRDVDELAIDTMYFSTFFGGGSSSWATTQDELILFDDFEVYELDS